MVLSASEMNDQNRAFCILNFPRKFQHFYKTLSEQGKGETVCTLCTGTMESEMFGPCKPLEGADVDLLFSGSPCDPFSQQRSKRFSNGSVKDHAQFQTTMGEVTDLYHAYTPRIGVFEQVWGFCMPFERNGKNTPKDEFLDCGEMLYFS